MVTVVVCINLGLTLVLLLVAWLIWRLRLKLAQVADVLIVYERVTHAALQQTPEAIAVGRMAIRQTRRGDIPAELKLLRIQQVLNLLAVGLQIAQQTVLLRQTRFFRKALAKYTYK
ncbi:hypothetical protein [Chroogloeocystis siderophila]|jgi:hydrogenase maturation factor HypF (carbamoyltransferase family)|uniref:Uncharacterized protein n=1 Tax=Chroogloeocystis siderophila 5.2 s.c.1 TaxID=247279 RepID=A0A1U7HLE4_9CHRO|nr:hypothetical protein [Chroogloeocystis siderophila]OKH24345.1 hypothetical protein NIES1031_16330 [Chroogloeocystis siderophila 5.2 s.c.1]